MNKNVHVYYYWGIHLDTETDIELIGSCPFCQHDDSRTGKGHFYVNQKTAAFCCKSGGCGKEGSWKDFLEYLYLDRLRNTKESDLLKLTKNQGLPLPILKKKQIAYDKKRGYLYPIYNEQHEVVDIRLFQFGRKEHSTKSGQPGLTCLKELTTLKEKTTIYICESWRNEVALEWLLWRNKIHGRYLVISTCGSNQFRQDWGKYFRGHDICIVYDHDDAGYGFIEPDRGKVTGSRKVEAYTRHYARSLRYIVWPTEKKNGYDIRDFVCENKNNPEKAWELFRGFIKKQHKDDLGNPLAVNEQDRPKENISLQSLIDTISSVYKLDQGFIEAIKLSLATAISTRLPGDDNVWLFLVGPPSSGKTIILKMFKNTPLCRWESTLSSKALISGWGLQTSAGNNNRNTLDFSILADINQKCLVLKDYTEVLSVAQTERDAIFSILRGAYDGMVSRPFGTGLRRYICSFSMLAGVTYEIKGHSTASLGERFLHYNLHSNLDEELVQEKALDTQLLGTEQVMSLENLVAEFLKNDYDYDGPALVGRVPRWFRDRIKPLARLIAYLRTTVQRHDRGLHWGEIVYEPVKESGNRLAVQLEKLAISLSLIEDKPQIDEEIYNLIKKIAFDTVSSTSTKIVMALANSAESLSTTALAERIGLGNRATSHMEDLEILKLVERNGTAGTLPAYKATKLIKDLWSRSK